MLVRVTGFIQPLNSAEDESTAFFSKHERLLNLCLLELEGEVMS